jgi:pteridine reductase
MPVGEKKGKQTLMVDWKSKHVLVTGGGKRLGKALAEYFHSHGARVSAHYFTTLPTPLSDDRFASFQCDLREGDAVRSLAVQAEKRFGAVDLLINSASDFYPTDPCSENAWKALFDLNLKAPYFLSCALRAGIASRRGSIIHLCDIHSAKPLKRFGPYCATKGGLWTLTRTMAAEWAPEIRVNSVSPGTVLPPENFTPEQNARAAARALFQRIGSPNDIVEAVAFLARSHYITGFDLKVDGGASLQ